MNIDFVKISQIIGTISIFLIFVINSYIALTTKNSINLKSPYLVQRLLIVIDVLIGIILWFSVYGLFLFVVRFLSLANLATIDELRIISGFGALIPLIGQLIQIYLARKIEKKEGLI